MYTSPVIATTVSVIETDDKNKTEVKTEEQRGSSNSSVTRDRLIAELVKRGVDRRWASNYISNASAESLLKIEDLIEYFNHINKTDKKKIKSPGGFLRTMIEEDWSLPPDFQLSRQQKDKATEQKRAAEESVSKFQSEIEYQKELNKQGALAFDSLTADEQEQRIKAKIAELKASQHWDKFKHMTSEILREHVVYMMGIFV